MAWVERETIDYKLEELPFDDKGRLGVTDPSKIRIKIPGLKYPYDIGAWCYTEKKKPFHGSTSARSAVVLIKTESLRCSRFYIIDRFLDYLIHNINLGRSTKSFPTALNIFKKFIDWCDQNNPEALDNKKYIPEAVRGYSDELINKVRTSSYHINSACYSQCILMIVLKWIYNDKDGDLLEGIRKIRHVVEANNSTEPPSQSNANVALMAYKALFEQLSNFVIKFDRFPIEISLPDEKYLFYPNKTAFYSISKLRKNRFKRRVIAANKDRKCSLGSAEEIYQELKSGNERVQNKFLFENIKNDIDSANTDEYHHRRILAAALAQQAFIMLFSANTGMGLSQLSQLLWENQQYSVISERQGFKTIKYRAGNKEVSFLLTSSFINTFNKYLKLRDYFFRSFLGQSCNLLFFSIYKNTLQPLPNNFSYLFSKRLKNFFDLDININNRQWRAYKGDWLIRNTDLATTSMILQNTMTTVLKHYATGSEVNAVTELSEYYESFNKNVVLGVNDRSVSISVGQCLSIDSPKTNNSTSIFQPNCRHPEGCLFCEHYAVKADETDLKKIYSFKYVIEQTRLLAASERHFQELFNPVQLKIDMVIERINASKQIEKNKHEKVKKEVYKYQQLDPFWARKLDMLIDLELI